jgi:Domain of unknown function (DUF1857)
VFTVTDAIPVNVPGEPLLTRSDVWRGLVEKSRNAVPFVDAMSYCQVTKEISPSQFDRDIIFHGEPMKERITLEPESKVTFERLSGSVLGTIWNTIEEERGALMLRFTFTLSVEGIADGSPEERAYADQMTAGYVNAVRTTLATIRKNALQV